MNTVSFECGACGTHIPDVDAPGTAWDVEVGLLCSDCAASADTHICEFEGDSCTVCGEYR